MNDIEKIKINSSNQASSVCKARKGCWEGNWSGIS